MVEWEHSGDFLNTVDGWWSDGLLWRKKVLYLKRTTNSTKRRINFMSSIDRFLLLKVLYRSAGWEQPLEGSKEANKPYIRWEHPNLH